MKSIMFNILLILFLVFESLSLNIRSNSKKEQLSSFLFDYNQLKVSFSQKSVDTNDLSTKLYAYYEKPNSQISFSFNKIDNQEFLARGIYEPTRFKQGWDKLYVKTNDVANPLVQCWSAGYLEGYLTQKVIYDNHLNAFFFFLDNPNNGDKIKKFYSQIHKNLSAKLTIDFFLTLDQKSLKQWAHLACIKAQLEGMTEGYNKQAKKEEKLSIEEFYLMNSQGNYNDLIRYMEADNLEFKNTEEFFTDENYKKFYKTTKIDEIWEKLTTSGHCSAIIKIVNNNGEYDLLTGHATWSGYAELLRMMKFYDFAYETKNVIVGLTKSKLVFSSYPASIYSGDDFYVTSNKLVITQSTILPINVLIYKNAIDVKTYVPDFMRIMVTNHIATTAFEWYDVLSSFPSHLYSTQWLVLDYKVFEKFTRTKQKPEEGLFILIEEIPGLFQVTDFTKLLFEHSYFGSFNIAYFKKIQERSGITHFENENINLFSPQFNPRLTILSHFQDKIRNLKDFKNLIQYNGYLKKDLYFPSDPSFNNPEFGISSRGDLLINKVFSGGIDYKIVDLKMVNNMEILTKCGPTNKNNPNLTTFSFKNFENDVISKYHNGMPDSFHFKSFIFRNTQED